MTGETVDTPSIFGRERFHIDALAKLLLAAAKKRHDYTEARETRRGATFDVALVDSDGAAAGTARVTIELLPQKDPS